MPALPSWAQSQKVIPALGNRSEAGIIAEPIIPKACSMPCICRTFTKASSVLILVMSGSSPYRYSKFFSPDESCRPPFATIFPIELRAYSRTMSIRAAKQAPQTTGHPKYRTKLFTKFTKQTYSFHFYQNCAIYQSAKLLTSIKIAFS